MDQDHQIMTREVILWSEWAEFSQDLADKAKGALNLTTTVTAMVKVTTKSTFIFCLVIVCDFLFGKYICRRHSKRKCAPLDEAPRPLR